MLKCIRLAGFAVFLWAVTGCASKTPHAASAPHPSRNACVAAAEKASAGPHSPDFAWALRFGSLARCGETGAVALARALREAGGIVDPVLMNSLVVQASSSRHPRILQAALDLALDRSAPTAARVAGLHVALRQHTVDIALPGGVEDLSTMEMGEFCLYDYLSHAHYASERALPPGHREDIAAAMRRIGDDEAESRPLRDLARCVARKVAETAG